MYEKIYEVRWDDVDPLQHLRHTAYSTYAAQTRLGLFKEYGVDFLPSEGTPMSPVLFREELIYRREVRLDDTIRVTGQVSVLSPDATSWAMRHEIFRGDGVHAATVSVSGAWIDLDLRKLTAPSADVAAAMNGLPRTDDFIVAANHKPR